MLEAHKLGNNMSSGTPCGACKFLRRKCIKGCVFAPYFLSEHGTESFCAVHKVFGASNVSKLLSRIPLPEQRREAILSIKYEAQARLKDPIYGCVRTIFALERQVEHLQSELQVVKAQLSSRFTAAGLYPQQQLHQLQAIANGPTSPTTPCDSLLSSAAPTASWPIPLPSSPSSCANYVAVKEENCQTNALNYLLGLSNTQLENFAPGQLLDTLQRNGFAIEQAFANEADMQALNHALL